MRQNVRRRAAAMAVALLAVPAIVACGDDTPAPLPDRHLLLLDLTRDLVPHTDVYAPPPRDLGRDGQTCTTGTADNCASCGDSCPPTSPVAAVRVCLSGKCNIQCRDESYDVNGSVSDDCEVKDDLPVHETMASAKDLGQASDCDSVKQTTAVVPSDDRLHLSAPTDRANGRPDWFKLYISDKIGCIVEGTTKVSLAALPTAAFYRVTATYVCEDGKQLNPDSKTGYGGATLELKPPVSCTTLGDDSGTLYIKVAKESGPHSAASYTVEIQP